MFSFLHDIDGNRSSKRLVAFIAMGCIVIAAIFAVFGKIIIPDYMFNDLTDIVMFGLGAIFGERLTQRKDPL